VSAPEDLVTSVSSMSMGKSRDSDLRMSECALKFACAVANPFSAMAQGCCLPTAPARPSQKVTCYTRGIGNVGTGGFGYLLVSPCLSNNNAFAYVTGSTYAGSGSDQFQPFSATADVLKTGVSAVNMTNIPYTTTQIWRNNISNVGTVVSGRIVSVGVKVTYTGQLNTTSGVISSFYDPAHLNTVCGLTANTLFNRKETVICPTVPGESCFISMTPTQPSEFGYGNTEEAEAVSAGNAASAEFQIAMNYPWVSTTIWANNSSTVAGGAVGVVSLAGLTAGASFYYEIVTHLEYVGELADPISTPAHSDYEGMQRVVAVAGQLPAIMASNPKQRWGDAFMRALRDVYKEAKPIVGAAVKTAILSALA